MSSINTFKAEELCSRKLWEIVNRRDSKDNTPEALQAALDELAERRHYLKELRDLGIVNHGVH